MSPAEAIAHVAEDGRIHSLSAHLADTAHRAKTAAVHFHSADWGELAGLWHDLGKYAPKFQAKIRSESGIDAHLESPGRVDHSTAGALLALKEFGPQGGLALAFAIAGHHAGLDDKTNLDSRFEQKQDHLDPALAAAGAAVPKQPKPAQPPFLASSQGKTPDDLRRGYEFWVRMLFSALVDADFLDTEAFHAGGTGGKPAFRTTDETLDQLREKFDAHMVAKQASAAETDGSKSAVNRARDRILQACRERADDPPGVFQLTAPTGAGKTLAAMAFALNHALKHGLRRAIVVIPFTSIIEQNAEEYRDVFGAANVVEHHASLDPKKESPRNRVACENWDAPIVVTTSVQFFESLLANRGSRCRKLHNVAKSVVIFDEVQTLPAEHLTPILDLLKELVRSYGVSLVLSTATQPALGQRSVGLSGQFPGFERVTEIVADLPRTFAELRRVEVQWPTDLDRPTIWEELAAEIGREPRVLAVVHKRDDARTLAKLLPDDTLHLSALMCAAHRSAVIARIKKRLKNETGGPVRVVSTQLVEAGVDLDFPVVYRAFGGLDSIAQAAGRCNRNGKLLPNLGQVRIFVAPSKPPKGTPARAACAARMLLAADPSLDALDPAVFDRYFREVYFTAPSLDRDGIQADRAAWKFKTVAEKFAMIEDDGSDAVLVPYGDGVVRLEELRAMGPSRYLLRALQPYVVTLYPQQVKALEEAGALEEVVESVLALRVTHRNLYSDRFGLVLDGPLAADPSALVS
jgi:CRISPR-associated endonuclease/helicase Cas3